MIQENWKWIITTALSAISIVVAIAVYTLSIQEKSISIKSLKLEVISEKRSDLKKFSLSYNGVPVEKLYQLIVELNNDGDTPITKSDFETPLVIQVKKDGEIFDADVVATEPPNIPVTLHASKNSIEISPLLLNPGDSLSVRVITNTVFDFPSVTGRITGIGSIDQDETRLYAYKALFAIELTSAVAVLAGYGFVAGCFITARKLKQNSISIPTQWLLGIVILLGIAGAALTGPALRWLKLSPPSLKGFLLIAAITLPTYILGNIIVRKRSKRENISY